METKLGHISHAKFGLGGYQDAMIGLSITLSGNSWGCGDFKGTWGIERGDYCKWTEEERLADLGRACMFLQGLLSTSKKQSVSDLVGLPIEATFDGMMLKSWRLLTEVLP